MNQNVNINSYNSKLKNIVYILDTFPKISETFILNDICHLIDLGFEIKIISLKEPTETIQNENFHKYKLSTKTTYKSLEELDDFNQDLKDFIVGTELIHAHFAHNAALSGGRIANKIKIPFTVTIHAYEIFRQGIVDKNKVEKICKYANLVFTPSIYNRDFISNLVDVDEDKIKVVRATINNNKFHLKKKQFIKKDEYQLTYCGRLIEKKGIEYLINAAHRLRTKRNDFHVNIIGTGHLEKELKELTESLGVAEFVSFMGEQTNEVFLEELKKSDLFISPCIIDDNGDRDVCPLTIQEAMAMLVPVISTDVASIPELIKNGVSGVLVPPKDSNSLEVAIDNLLDDATRRENISKNARQVIDNEFNNNIQTKKLLRYWNNLT